MDNTIFDKKFIKVKECQTQPYFYGERLGIDSVGFILFNKETNEFGLINERKPPMDQRIKEENDIRVDFDYNPETFESFLSTAFGGSNDYIDIETYKKMNSTERILHFMEIVQNEVREEAGYEISNSEIEYVTKSFVSTQQNQICYLFIVDITGKENFEPEYENDTEAMSEVVWYSKERIVEEVIDWKAKTIIFQIENMKDY